MLMCFVKSSNHLKNLSTSVILLMNALGVLPEVADRYNVSRSIIWRWVFSEFFVLLYPCFSCFFCDISLCFCGSCVFDHACRVLGYLSRFLLNPFFTASNFSRLHFVTDSFPSLVSLLFKTF